MLASIPQKIEARAGPNRRLLFVSLLFSVDFLVV
jgi:hypothetical protein